MIPAKAGTTNGLRLFMQFPIALRVCIEKVETAYSNPFNSSRKRFINRALAE